MPSKVMTLDIRSVNLHQRIKANPVTEAWLRVIDHSENIEAFFKILSEAKVIVPGKSEPQNRLSPYRWQDQSLRLLTPFYTSPNEMVIGLRKTGKSAEFKFAYIVMPFSEFLSYLIAHERSTHMNPGCAVSRYFAFEEIEFLMSRYGKPIETKQSAKGNRDAGGGKKLPSQLDIEIASGESPSTSNLEAWKNENEIALLLKTSPAKVRRHIKAVLSEIPLTCTPSVINSDSGEPPRYSLEVVYHVGRRLSGFAGSQDNTHFSLSFSNDNAKTVTPMIPPKTSADKFTKSRIVELEKDIKQLHRELDKKSAALNRAIDKNEAAKLKLDSKVEKVHSFYKGQIGELKQEIENLRASLANIASDLIIPASLEDILKLAELFFRREILLLPDAWRSANQYQFANEQKILVEAWAMIIALAVHLYRMKFKDDSFSVAGFQDLTGFELALRESKKTKKDKEIDSSREFLFNDQIIKVYPHIKSRVRDNFRLYFYIIEDEQKILICHLGQHLPTSQDKII